MDLVIAVQTTVSYTHLDVYKRQMEGSVNSVIKRVGTGLDELGFIFFMDNQLQQIEYKLKKHNLQFVKLKDNEAYLYYGNNEAPKDKDVESYLKDKMLVQCYDCLLYTSRCV